MKFFILFRSFILLVIPLCSQTLRTEGDIHRAFTEGWVDYDAYTTLLSLYENKLSPCDPSDELLLIPNVVEEDLTQLQTFCGRENFKKNDLPKTLVEKIALFVQFDDDPKNLRTHMDYRFTRDLSDTAPAFEREHVMTVKYASPHLKAISQAKANSYGDGYFTRILLSLHHFGPFNELKAGNFRIAKGLGLALGGAALAYQYNPIAPETFAHTFLLPRSSRANGVYAAISAGPWSPFALALLNDDPYSVEKTNSVLGVGMDCSKKPWYLGLAAVHSRLQTKSGSEIFAATALGLFGELQRPGLDAKVEFAFSDSGAAAGFDAVGGDGPWEAGVTVREYTQKFVNPAGKGKSFFYVRIQPLYTDEESLSVRGLRRGERLVNAFLSFHSSTFSIRPSLSVARSDLYDENRWEAALRETFILSWKKSSGRIEQSVILHDSGAASTPSLQLKSFYDFAPAQGVEARFQARFTFESVQFRQAFAKAEALCHLGGIVNLLTGYSCLWTSTPEQRSAEGQIHLEERTALPRAGEVRIFVSFNHFYKPNEITPGLLGLSLSLPI